MKTSKMPTPVYLSPWKANNIVVHFDLKVTFSFARVMCSKNLSYEPELFPAALISKWHPIHVTLFPNGKGNISGLKQAKDIYSILREITPFVKSQIITV